MTTADTAIQRARPANSIPGYRLVSLLGKGGMGEVHQAVQLSLERTVAVKLLAPELARDSQFVARFEKEGAALATLRHPNVVSIVDRGRTEDTYYLVMEFVDGPSLRERMRAPDFDALTAMRTLLSIAKAIDYAHGRGVVHRDLKPENILFDEQAGLLAKVTDFGLAGFVDGPQHNLTATHMAMGTGGYMAPEQRVDARTAGPRADLYALGVLLYELVTGELPQGSFAPPSQRKAGLDKRLDAIVERCLKPDPEDRYPTVAAFIAELEQLVPVSTTAPVKTTALQRFVFKARAVARRVGVGVAMTVVLVATAIVATAYLRASVDTRLKPAGVELMAEFSARAPLTTPGRLDKTTRTLTLGEGPDTVQVLALGRKASLDKGAVRYGPSLDGAGRAVLDAQVQGTGLRFAATVDTQALTPGTMEPFLALFRGPRAEARSALLLLGEQGRYVALVVSASGAEPSLEWALTPEKRGTMTAPLPTATSAQHLELKIDPDTGSLSAIIGTGRDARVLGDALALGKDWKELFGEAPRAAVGCLSGTCAFAGVRLEGLTPRPPPEPPPVVVPLDPLGVKAPVKGAPLPLKPSEARPSEVKAPEVKPPEVKASAKPPEVKPPEVKPTVKPTELKVPVKPPEGKAAVKPPEKKELPKKAPPPPPPPPPTGKKK